MMWHNYFFISKIQFTPWWGQVEDFHVTADSCCGQGHYIRIRVETLEPVTVIHYGSGLGCCKFKILKVIETISTQT